MLQIPIFFSLYKVIFVTLELRHAPWVGWITDLSAPDPSSILNLFGLLPFAPPDPSSLFAIVSLGVLPILLGIAWLIPLVSFVAILFFGPRMGAHGKGAATVATTAIGASLFLSLIALVCPDCLDWFCLP